MAHDSNETLVERVRCERCGGDTHYPDPLCYRCSEERGAEVYGRGVVAVRRYRASNQERSPRDA